MKSKKNQALKPATRFFQWMKSYFDKHYGGQEYNAVDRRGGQTFAAKENTAGNK